MSSIYLPFVTGGSGLAGNPEPEPKPEPVPETEYKIIFSVMNEARYLKSLPPLVLHQGLIDSAQFHAEDMVAKDYYTHNSIDGTKWSERITRFYPVWSTLGENIHTYHKDELTVVKGWMNSKGHYDCIVHPMFKEVGIGCACNPDGEEYRWVVDFGARWD